MNVIMILIAFGCGAFWGYAAGIQHCDKYHRDDNDTPRFRGPYL